MTITVDAAAIVPLTDEAGEHVTTGLVRQPSGAVLVVIGGTTLGRPIPLDADGQPIEEGETPARYAFDHPLDANAIDAIADSIPSLQIDGMTVEEWRAAREETSA